MAVYMNAKGTTNTSFQFGKRGNKVFGTATLPTSELVSSGDLWLDQSNGSIKIASVTDGSVSWSNIVSQGDAITSSDLTVTGNLTVQGTQTVVNTTTLNVEDNIITLNSNFDGADNTVDVGIEVNRGDEPNVTFIWDESEGEWTLGNESLVAGGFIGDLHGNVIGSIRPNGSPNIITGNTVNAGTLVVTNAYTFPSSDGTADQVLTTDGSGNLAFTTLGDTVTDYGSILESQDVTEKDFGDIVDDTRAPTPHDSYTVSEAGSILIATAGDMIFVSDEVGGATMAFYDGTNWRRIQDRAVISS